MQRKWIKMSYALWLFNGMVLSWQLSRHGNFGYDTQWFTSTLIKTSWGELSHRVDRTWHSWIVKVLNIYIQHILSKLILCVPQCHTVKPSSEQNTLNDLVTLWCVYKTSISDLLRCLIIQVRVYLGESEQDMTPAPLFFVDMYWIIVMVHQHCDELPDTCSEGPAKGRELFITWLQRASKPHHKYMFPPAMFLCNHFSDRWWALWQPTQPF